MSGRNATKVGWTILIEAQITGPSYWEKDAGVKIYSTREEAEASLRESYVSSYEDNIEDAEEEQMPLPEVATEDDFRNWLGEWVVPCIEYADGSLDVGANEDQDWFGWSYSAEDLAAIRNEFGW